MALLSSVARHLLSLRNSTSYFASHHPCRPEHLVSTSSLDGFRSQAQREIPHCWHQPASLCAFKTGTRELLIAHSSQEPGDSPKDWLAPAGLHAVCTQMLRTAPQPQLHSFQWQRQVNNGGARKIIEQQEADEKEQAQLKSKQTKFDRSLGARKAKNAEHQSVIAHMSDVRTPRSLLNKSEQQKWEVVEFHPDSTIIETTKTPEQLNLQPRDISIFATNKLGVQAQRATITPRNGAVLFRTEIAKAIIYKDRAVLFHSRRLKDTVHIAQTIAATIGAETAAPFEFRVLEALLAETAHHFEGKSRRLSFLAESIVTEVSHSLRASTGELQRLLPIQRALTEMQHDVKEATEAIAEVGQTTNASWRLLLLDRGHATALDWLHPLPHKPLHTVQTAHMRIAAALLESYERQVQSVEGALKEMVENMDSTRDVWAMQLDTIRNRIIRVELLVAVASFSLMMSTVPASFFGMNLTSGLEVTPFHGLLLRLQQSTFCS
ncbi:MAG: mitochondrial rna splicing [Trebouxia sp. A1-2]|nr:MAG: mitochondrial rna splicing [Trebouxia sp. A1-2]